MASDLYETLQALDDLLKQRGQKDEAVVLIVEALHKIADKLPTAGIKSELSSSPDGNAPKGVGV